MAPPLRREATRAGRPAWCTSALMELLSYTANASTGNMSDPRSRCCSSLVEPGPRGRSSWRRLELPPLPRRQFAVHVASPTCSRTGRATSHRRGPRRTNVPSRRAHRPSGSACRFTESRRRHRRLRPDLSSGLHVRQWWQGQKEQRGFQTRHPTARPASSSNGPTVDQEHANAVPPTSRSDAIPACGPYDGDSVRRDRQETSTRLTDLSAPGQPLPTATAVVLQGPVASRLADGLREPTGRVDRAHPTH